MGWELFDKRGYAAQPGRPRQTHCIHGHPFDAENTREYRMPDGRIQRGCKTCAAERQRAKQMARTDRQRAFSRRAT